MKDFIMWFPMEICCTFFSFVKKTIKFNYSRNKLLKYTRT